MFQYSGKLKPFGAAGLLAVAFTGASASANVMVSSFENDLSSTLGPTWNEGGTTVEYTTEGATEGSYAVKTTRGTGWGNALQLDGGVSAATVAQYDFAAIDVTVPNTSEWRQVIFVMQGAGYGYSTHPGAVEDQGTVPGETVTLYYDITNSHTAAAASPSWWQIILITQGGDAGDPAPSQISTTFDNFRFVNEVPEPASLSLVALGLAAISSRRRR